MKPIIIAGVLLISNLAHSFPGANKAPKDLLGKSSSEQTLSCPNFSGHWKGQCTTAGEVSEESLLIDQAECSVIGIQNHYYVIGGRQTVIDTFTSEGAEYESVVSTKVDVTDDQQGLQAAVAITISRDGEIFDEDMVGASMTFSDKQLVYFAKSKDSETSCIYDKID
ncbi:MAG: hypothetical protein SGJ18_12725 [Pseudomonadota bacterium]|nr:hypothetical protein [Pseudomonadota bacterium]